MNRSKSYYNWEKRLRGLYNSWHGMMRRCYNPKHSFYQDYGGRGIKVCKEWKDFHKFLVDMKPTWKKELTLERINNSADYSKENCCWATRKEQANNRRNNRFITYNDETKTLAQWISYFNLKGSTVRQRYYIYKWSLDRCFER